MESRSPTRPSNSQHAAWVVDGADAGGERRRPSEKELFRAAGAGDGAVFSSIAHADLAAALSLRNEDGRFVLLLHVASSPPPPATPRQDEEGLAPIHSAVSSGNAHIISILHSCSIKETTRSLSQSLNNFLRSFPVGAMSKNCFRIIRILRLQLRCAGHSFMIGAPLS
ncbi:hypothetical protein GUJ93_ZPchr0013g34465 [Zizania palustris]|uniref:Uncharacterized protein n=1 Tax=Zizania palustris TaxID=103762 RepID=A0A8J6BXD3_ZIZPA|nr:hypothetical protein GUJ93_ZPchr0013g34465 [Zizania palustris]